MDIKEQFIRLHRKFLLSFCKFQDHLCNTQGFVEKTQISKKMLTFNEKSFGFFSVLLNMKNNREHFIGVQKVI